MMKYLKLFIFLIALCSFALSGCSEYEGQSYDDGYYEGYEDGFAEGEQFALENGPVPLPYAVEELLSAKEYDAIDALREIFTDNGVFGDYVVDLSEGIIHTPDCEQFDMIKYEDMCTYSKIDPAVEKGYTTCDLCIGEYK